MSAVRSRLQPLSFIHEHVRVADTMQWLPFFLILATCGCGSRSAVSINLSAEASAEKDRPVSPLSRDLASKPFHLRSKEFESSITNGTEFRFDGNASDDYQSRKGYPKASPTGLPCVFYLGDKDGIKKIELTWKLGDEGDVAKPLSTVVKTAFTVNDAPAVVEWIAGPGIQSLITAWKSSPEKQRLDGEISTSVLATFGSVRVQGRIYGDANSPILTFIFTPGITITGVIFGD